MVISGPSPLWVEQCHGIDYWDTTALGLFVGSSLAIGRVAGEGCVGLTEVLAAGVAVRTWIGLDISD